MRIFLFILSIILIVCSYFLPKEWFASGTIFITFQASMGSLGNVALLVTLILDPNDGTGKVVNLESFEKMYLVSFVSVFVVVIVSGFLELAQSFNFMPVLYGAYFLSVACFMIGMMLEIDL